MALYYWAGPRKCRSHLPITAVYLSPLFMSELRVDNRHVAIGDHQIVRGLSLTVPPGEVHAIMGPNGSGKSTLAKVVAGHPDYHVTKGKITMDGEDVLAMEADERARKGLFLAFQYPSEIPGVTIANFLRAALQARLPEGEELEATDYYAKLYEKMELLGMDRSFTSRAVNEGFSGSEKKRTEILQLAMLEPKYGVLDETDSGLDIDALKTVAHGVNTLRGSNIGILLITHYQRILNYIVPDHVHVMVQGRIVRSGGKDLALELEERGYDGARAEADEPVLTRKDRQPPTTTMKTENKAVDIEHNRGDFASPEVQIRDAGRGLSEKTIHYISDVKEDPDW